MDIKNLIYFTIGIQVILIFYIYFTSDKKNFIDRVENINTFLLAIGIFLTFLIFQKNYEKNIIDTGLTVIEKAQKSVIKSITEGCIKAPNFCSSILETMQTRPKGKVYNYQSDDKNTIIYLTYCILQSVEDYIMSSSYTNYSDVEWAAFYIFLFSGAEKLQEMYTFYKFLIGIPSQKYIEEVIKIVNTTHLSTEKQIEDAARKFVHSKEFRRIIIMSENHEDVLTLR